MKKEIQRTHTQKNEAKKKKKKEMQRFSKTEGARQREREYIRATVFL